MNITKSTVVAFLFITMIFSPQYTLSAVNSESSVPINITGVITAEPCIINNNVQVLIDFGEIPVSEVNGHNYAESKNISISCNYRTSTPYVKIIGSALSGAPDNVLKTSGVAENNSILGVAIYQGSDVDTNYPINLNKTSIITRGLTGQSTKEQQFTITAVPYTTKSEQLVAGPFSTSATLVVMYQ